MPLLARLSMCDQSSDSYITGSLELMPAKPKPAPFALLAMASMRPSDPTTYGQWLQVNKTMAPDSCMMSARAIEDAPAALFAFGSWKGGAASPGSIPALVMVWPRAVLRFNTTS